VSVRKRAQPVIQVTHKSNLTKVVIGLLALLMLYVAVTFTIRQDEQMERVLTRQAEIQAALSKEETALRNAQELHDSFGTDAYIEKVAREKLNMLLPGEILFVD
jgi:cell division protein FtsB